MENVSGSDVSGYEFIVPQQSEFGVVKQAHAAAFTFTWTGNARAKARNTPRGNERARESMKERNSIAGLGPSSCQAEREELTLGGLGWGVGVNSRCDRLSTGVSRSSWLLHPLLREASPFRTSLCLEVPFSRLDDETS